MLLKFDSDRLNEMNTEYFMVQYTLTVQQFYKFSYLSINFIFSSYSNFMLLNWEFVGLFFRNIVQRCSSCFCMTSIILMPLMMFSGMYTRLDSVQSWIGWIQYISPFKYGLHCLLLNEFHEEKYLTIFRVYDYKRDLQITLSFWQNILVLIGLIGFFYDLAFILLKKMSSNLTP